MHNCITAYNRRPTQGDSVKLAPLISANLRKTKPSSIVELFKKKYVSMVNYTTQVSKQPNHAFVASIFHYQCERMSL